MPVAQQRLQACHSSWSDTHVHAMTHACRGSAHTHTHLAVVLALEHGDQGEAHGAVAVIQVLGLPASGTGGRGALAMAVSGQKQLTPVTPCCSSAVNKKRTARWIESAAARLQRCTPCRSTQGRPQRPRQPKEQARGHHAPVLLGDGTLAGVLLVISAGQRGLQLREGGLAGMAGQVTGPSGCMARRSNSCTHSNDCAGHDRLQRVSLAQAEGAARPTVCAPWLPR